MQRALSTGTRDPCIEMQVVWPRLPVVWLAVWLPSPCPQWSAGKRLCHANLKCLLGFGKAGSVPC